MIRCLCRVVILTGFCCIAFSTHLHAAPDSLVVPATLTAQLQEFRQKDDLAGWIYHRMAFVDEKPAERIGFLLQTQQQAWRTYKTYEERLAWLYLLALQGYYQLQSGNILSSITAYENALQFYESYPLPDAGIIDYVLKPLGNNYTRLADYTTALFIHQKTLTLALKENNAETIASVYSNMAACARWKGDLPAAENACKQGIAYVNKQQALYGLLLGTFADVLAEQKRYDTAALVCGQALQKLQRFPTDTTAVYWHTSALQTASRIALHQSNYTAAVNYADKAMQLFQRYYPATRQREKAKLCVLLGDIALPAGDSADALIAYQQALLLLLPSWKPSGLLAIPPEEMMYSENTIGDALAGKAAALQVMNKKEKALEHYLAMFAAERKLRSAFFYNESKYRELQVTRSRAGAAMQLAYTLWSTTGDKKYRNQLLLIAELSKAQVLQDERNGGGMPTTLDTASKKIKQLQEAIIYYQHELVQAADKKAAQELLQSAEYELALLNKKIRQQVSPGAQMLTIEQLYSFFKRIPADVSVLEFFDGADSSFIIELDATGIQSVHLIPAGRQLQITIPQFMQQWFGRGVAALINDPKRFYNECHALYASIFGDYNWKPAQRYILVPDGIFNYLPFDALLTDRKYKNNYGDWPWLFKKVSLSQAVSLKTWYEQQTATYHTGSFTGFFVAAGRNGQLPVLAVEQEYNLLKKTVTGNYYLNATATWQQFNTSADAASVLHIGSHALSSATDSFPCLQLYDKPFYLFDLRYKNFAPALVVLGACKTADGLLLEGEGINSLSRGFTAAGAGGVVSGLWNVNDETAIEFTKLFYQLLQQYDPAMALQQAKLQWLNAHRDNPILQLPYYWSGFVYSGHLQKVNLQQQKSYVGWYSAGAFVIAGIVVFFVLRRRGKGKGGQELK